MMEDNNNNNNNINNNVADQKPQPPHPRRAPAYKSVSLLHSSNGSKATWSPEGRLDGTERSGSSPSSLKPLIGKDDSGESSNADKWFENSNNEVASRDGNVVDSKFRVRNHTKVCF